MDFSKLEVRNNPERKRFEIEIEGQYAIAEYILAGDRIIFTHTEVPVAFEGHGLANKLAHTALEYARAQQLRVMPLCPYIAGYLKHHPEYQDLLAAGFHV